MRFSNGRELVALGGGLTGFFFSGCEGMSVDGLSNEERY